MNTGASTINETAKGANGPTPGVVPSDPRTRAPEPDPVTEPNATPPERPGAPLARPLAMAGALVIGLGGLIGTGAGVMGATGGTWSRPDTFVVFFGLCSLVSAVLALCVLLGRCRNTVGMTLLIGAGTLLVGGALSEAQLVAGVLGQEGGEFRVYHGVMLRTLMLAQLACAGLGFVLCALQVWSRDFKNTLPLAFRAIIAFAILGAIGAAVLIPSWRQTILDLPQLLTALAVVLGGVLAIVFAAAGGHTLIRSFEVTRDA